MSSTRNVIPLPSAAPERAETYSATDPEIAEAIGRAQQNLLQQQKPDGHWCGELLVDSTLCSDFVLFMHWLGEIEHGRQPQTHRPPSRILAMRGDVRPWTMFTNRSADNCMRRNTGAG